MRVKRFLSLLLILALTLPCLAACHGSVERVEFQMPPSFDEEREYAGCHLRKGHFGFSGAVPQY